MAVRGIAKAFWVEKLGCTEALDLPYGDGTDRRWIELTTPDGNTRLVLDPRRELPDYPEALPTNPYFFYADDIEATFAELVAVGVEFLQPPVHQDWGWWSMFADSEGNRFALQQR